MHNRPLTGPEAYIQLEEFARQVAQGTGYSPSLQQLSQGPIQVALDAA